MTIKEMLKSNAAGMDKNGSDNSMSIWILDDCGIKVCVCSIAPGNMKKAAADKLLNAEIQEWKVEWSKINKEMVWSFLVKL